MQAGTQKGKRNQHSQNAGHRNRRPPQTYRAAVVQIHESSDERREHHALDSVY